MKQLFLAKNPYNFFSFILKRGSGLLHFASVAAQLATPENLPLSFRAVSVNKRRIQEIKIYHFALRDISDIYISQSLQYVR